MNDYILLPNGSSAIEASYRKTGISIYDGNPLIEALPPILNDDEVIKKLSRYPKFNEEDRNRDRKSREHMLMAISQSFCPYGIHIELESAISKSIRNGYINRNPLDRITKENFINGYRSISGGEYLCADSYSNTNYGIYIVGPPGVGKSMSIGLISSLYPQIVVHSDYMGNQMNQYQIVYLKTNLPHDASVKGLCYDIIQKIDGLIGTNYAVKTRNMAVNKLVPTIGLLFTNTLLGCLIIDEIQNITVSKQGCKSMIGFLLNIMSYGVPLILIGTNSSYSIIQKELRLARRGSGMGTLLFNRIEDKDSIEWKLITNMLFNSRILKDELENIEDFRNALYLNSQGIVDICSKMFVAAQVECLRQKKEKLTIDILEKTVRNKFSFVLPMLEAIKSNDYYRMSFYEDIVPISKKADGSNDNIIKKKLFIEDNKSKDLLRIERELELELNDYTLPNKNSKSNKVIKKSKIDVNELYDDDIRKIISLGRERNLTEYDSLKEVGLIKSL